MTEIEVTLRFKVDNGPTSIPALSNHIKGVKFWDLIEAMQDEGVLMASPITVTVEEK